MTYPAPHVNQAGEPIAPIPVHVSNAAELAGAGHRDHPRKLMQAVTLTRNIAAGQIVDFLPYDTTRLHVRVQAGGSNVVLCTDLSQAQDPANVAVGIPNPNGLLLTAGNTTPFKVDGVQRMWAVAPAAAQITWISLHERTS